MTRQKKAEEDIPEAAVCVLGMHRSGTSLVMRLLNLMGTYLGPPEQLMPSTEHNPKGYWEHKDLVHLNEEILNSMGGSWDEPPEFPNGWESSPGMAARKRRARTHLRREFQGSPLWGWKDPRNSLTLPFWRKLIPDLRCVICIRNPLDVAASLQHRDGFSTTKCMDLWLRYMVASLENTSGLPRLIVFYEDYFEDWRGEAQRLARFVGAPDDRLSDLRTEMESAIEGELWHHRSAMIDALDTPELTVPAKALYFTLRSLTMSQQGKETGLAETQEFQQSLDLLAGYALAERRRLLALEADNSTLREQISKKDEALAKQRDKLADSSKRVAGLEADLRDTAQGASANQEQLALITGTLGYRMLERLRRISRGLAPEGTRRQAIVLAFNRGLEIILTQGWLRFLRRAVQVWAWLPHIRHPSVHQRRASSDDQYQLWLQAHALTAKQTKRSKQQAAKLAYRPLISIVMPVYDPQPAWLREAIDSVRAQLYDRWELCIADDGSKRRAVRQLLEEYSGTDSRIKVTCLKKNQGIVRASNAALALARGEFVGFLDHDDELKPDALFEVVRLLNERRDLDFIYSDEDKRDPSGRLVEPFFKPDWSPDLLMSLNYVTHFSVFRKELVDSLGGLRTGFDGSQDYDLVLRVTEQTDRIAHIPRPLYTWRKAPGSAAASVEAKDYAYRAARKALEGSLSRRGLRAEVEDGPFRGWYRVRYEIKDDPRVTIIIPTKDNLEMLRRCIESIEGKTTYKNYDILVIDNNSEKAETAEYLSKLRWPVVTYPHPFNFAKIVNFGARQSKSEFLLFLNNDTEVITPEWIEAMLEHGQRPDVAAVGARLLYPDGRVQHEGIIIGLGGGSAGKIDHGGYFGLGQSIRNCSAVTAACMLTRSSVFWELGGFDEHLRVAFNDVDYCLRAREKGYLITYTPFSTLYHQESATRGKLHPAKDEGFFRSRWGRPGEFRDPYYNPNLDLQHPFTVRL